MTVYDYRYLKVKVIHWPLSKVTQIQHFQISFLQIEAEFHIESRWDVGNETLFKFSRSHDHAHIYDGKIKKKNFFQNQEVDDLESWYTALGTWLPPIF